MTRSMTAYSRATSSEVEGITWSVEIHTINRKALDVNIYLPRELLFFDVELRKLIAQSLQRGQVTVRVNMEKGKEAGAAVPLLKKLKSGWERTAKSSDWVRKRLR